MLFRKKSDMNLTDNEIREVASKAATEYIRKNSRSAMNPEDCLDAELEAVKVAYKSRNHIWKGKPMTPEDVEIIAQTFLRLRPELSEMTRSKMLSRRRNEKATAIGVATAKAIITGVMGDSGMKYEVYYQRYRAKLIVWLDRSSVVVLHIHYKDILGKDFSGVVPALKVLNAAVERK